MIFISSAVTTQKLLLNTPEKITPNIASLESSFWLILGAKMLMIILLLGFIIYILRKTKEIELEGLHKEDLLEEIPKESS